MNNKNMFLWFTFSCLGLLVLLAFGSWLAVMMFYSTHDEVLAKVSHEKTPDVGAYPVYAPTFDTQLGEVRAGKAFLGKEPRTNTVYLLSAHHLLGEAGGLPRELAWHEVPEQVRSVRCASDDPTFEPLTFHEVIPIEGARKMDMNSCTQDLLVFRASEDLAPQALPFRTEPIGVDEPVWLYSSVSNDEKTLHLAVVTDVTEDWLEYVYLEDLDLTATSGAPVVDKEGRLVAINLGGYALGGLRGLGNPVSAVRNNLARATQGK
ncbi:Trypsin-like peptidase domain-containing protein [Sulfidibacter corallicola]|uniref:Trypsin-like peptidase domain-containing protein n=1 Tax=Sulfidibacter corallicola TaxID=2818388 RepID=A0A8A4THR2_SULCO|nr:serine protease [Sulfidibacter corallicola]QTD49037.1 trypsin-like peptidase domain-containing protein [Sulfidibacter corallicola]